MRKILAITALIGIWAESAHAQCPPTIPRPATVTDIQCYTLRRDPGVRCATALPPDICNNLNQTAIHNGLVTLDGFSWLTSNGFCAMSVDFGAGLQLYDFCPLGCFSADTQLLTGVSDEQTVSYARASSVTRPGTLISLADEATIDDVSIVPRSIRRIVHGPEDADLYVFALANGSTLRVTQHHPMVIDDGTIIEAQDVGPAMSFVGIDGASVAITSITREKPVGEVYNFETEADTRLGHVIVAEGVLVGDLKLQNELGAEQNSIESRR